MCCVCKSFIMLTVNTWMYCYKLIDQFGYQYFVMTPVFLKHYKGFSGPIILSKYPIIHDYNHKFEKGDNDLNHLLAVDIVHGFRYCSGD